MSAMSVPFLSEYDPVAVSGEGSLDPLGLYSIADRMGVLLAPGIRERQVHPLFLTAIAATSRICADFDDDVLAADEISRPWQVCEWYIVRGIALRARSGTDIQGLPGRQKAQLAIDAGIGLSAGSYLKVPSVFGFHGVYRLLARTLDVIDSDDRLGQNGYELLVVWENEQGLSGFVTGEQGPGRAFLDRMVSAVADGLTAGKTNRSGGWSGWQEIYEHLRHTRKPVAEAQLIGQWLRFGQSSFLTEIYSALLSSQGQGVWIGSKGDERRFHDFLARSCSPELREALTAIQTYETFCRLLTNAFTAILGALSVRQGVVGLSELESLDAVQTASRDISYYYAAAAEALDRISLAGEYERSFTVFSDKQPPDRWAGTLLDYHQSVQKSKPPAGKLPWIDQFSNGTVAVRAPYRLDDSPELPDEETYVHSYRTNSLWSFSRDLRMEQEVSESQT